MAVLWAPITAHAQPANDDCSGAIELTAGATCVPVAGTVAGATASQPGTVTCDGFQATPDDDVWYRFTATAGAHQIRVAGSTSFDAVIQLFSGGCNGTSIVCRDLISAGGTEVLDVTALTVGDEYLVRVYSWAATPSVTTDFTICVTASTLPPNDNCAGAITITPNPVCTPTTGTIASATNSAPASACGGSANDDVWYKFVATAADHTIQVTTGSGFDAVVDLRSGACNGTSINCVDVVSSNSTENLVASGLNVGETYFVRVYHFGTNIPANLGLSICVLGPVPPDCAADAGTITADLDEVCYVEGETVISATPDDNEFVPAGYEVVYVLTKGPGLLILEVAPTPDFLVAAEGGYTIHTLVYDPNTLDLGLIEPGVTTGFDVDHLLIQGGGIICGSLDVVGAPVTVLVCVTCDAVAGTIMANEPVVCLVDGMAMFSATQDGNSVVPTGFETVYVLTEGAGLVIVDVATTPDFMVTTEGNYTIHTLVYDPNTLDLGIVEIGVTTGFDVNALLIQGGGAICGSLDVAGAPVVVENCVTCDADAGTLTADAATVCLVEGLATLTATPDGNVNIPAGFEAVYVLTQGPGLVIVNAGAAPSFDVTEADAYTIHTLVYDPNTLDLGVVEIGVTTGFDVNALLIQGGGAICGSLDVAGAPIVVENCVTCDADAGTLTADAATVCLVEGLATLTATPDGNVNVPAGFETVYVLTQGPGLVIVNTGAAPSFDVTEADAYTIHTLVYDPNTLDLGIVEIGVTTGFDVNALLIQGGGDICGSLDVTGAQVTVQVCIQCDADAGTITADASFVCLVDDMAVMTATPNGDIVVPGGFEKIYVLTKGAGLLIVDAASSPDFMVTAEGEYTIHTLVYDPNTLDISIVEFGVTTGFDVNALLVQGGGTICASLDVAGAPVTVQVCVACNGGDVTTAGGAPSVNICQDSEADVIDFANSGISTNNYTYVLTDESDRIVTLLSGNALDFNSAAVGVYHVWGVSYDGNLLGADVGADIADLTNTGTCLELSASFVTVTVEICIGVAEADQLTWGIYPNPTEGLVTLNYLGADATVNIEVVDMGGRVVAQEGRAITNGQRHTMDLGALAPGMYTVRLTSGQQVTNLRVVVR